MGASRRPRRPRRGAAGSGATSSAKSSSAKPNASRRRGAKPVAGNGTSSPKARETRTDVSAGGVVYRRADDAKVEILLAARRTRRGEIAWGLAKGGIEPSESVEDAAIREVREETGVEATIEESLGDTRYFYVWEGVRIRKTVHFFLMRAVGGRVEDHDDEMEDVRWFPIRMALKRATYRGEREVLQRAAGMIR